MKFIPTSIVKRSKIAVWAPGAVLASVLVAGSAFAESKPYGAWESVSKDDNSVQVEDSFKIQDSFKSRYDTDNSSRVREDNDTDLRYAHNEDNDVTKTITKTRTEDNDTDTKIDFRQDNDWAYSSSEDNDITKTITKTHTEDNDVAVDFQIATPTQTLHKYQDQHAGHQGSSEAYGAARGHEVDAKGGTTAVVAGNDDSRNYGVQNTNVNQMPTNYAFVGGSSMAPIMQSNTSAGRDMGPKGVFAPVGNVGVDVQGDVGQQSNSGVSQEGASSNRATDSISSGISR